MIKVTRPNKYNLRGGGISAVYCPNGFGPIRAGRGPLHLVCQDDFRSLTFYGDEVRTVEIPGLGTVVSVTITESADTGSNSFSIFLPQADLRPDQDSVPVHSEGITTAHRVLAAQGGHPQSETGTAAPLDGTAPGGSCAAPRVEPGSTRPSRRTRSGTHSPSPLWLPGYRCGMCTRRPRTRIRAPRCAMTAPAAA